MEQDNNVAQDNNAQLTHTLTPALKTTTDKPPRRRIRILILVLLALVIIAQWVDSRRHISHLRQELNRRLGHADQMVTAASGAAQAAQQATQALEAKVVLLDERLLAMEGQSVALQAMYQEMSNSREQRLLAELEQTVTLAMQQLQFAGNVSAALLALENADARLAQEPQPQFMPLRRLLARDIERLKATPGGDVAGLALKLESVVTVVDNLPLAFDQRPRKGQSVAVPGGSSTGLPSARLLAADFWRDLAQSLSQLVRIERIEQRDMALLAPSQSFFLRENLKLRLLNARLALLQRDGKAFHENVTQAAVLLDRYFDARATSVVAARKSLASLAVTEVGAALPSLDETLSAVRQLKLTRDRVPRR